MGARGTHRFHRTNPRELGRALPLIVAVVLALGLSGGGLVFFYAKQSDLPVTAQDGDLEGMGGIVNGDVIDDGTGDAIGTAGTGDASGTDTATAASGGDAAVTVATTGEAPEESVELVRVFGKVVDQKGEPVAGTDLRWVSTPSFELGHDPAIFDEDFDRALLSDKLQASTETVRTTRSRQDGTFEFHVEKNSGLLIAHAEGYAIYTEATNDNAGARIARLMENVGRGGDAESIMESIAASSEELSGEIELTIELTRGGSISGRVVDDTSGQPAAGMIVRALPEKPGAGMGALITMGMNRKSNPSAVVRADGTYTIQGLPAGEHHLVPQTGRSEYLSVPARRAVTVMLQPGDAITGMDFEVALGGIIRGVVRDESGDPVEGAKVSAVPDINMMEALQHMDKLATLGEEKARTDAEGRFELTALSLDLTYAVRAESDDHAPGKSEKVELTDEHREAVVEVRLLRGSSISGIVHYADNNEAAADVRVRLMPNMKNMMSGSIMDFAGMRENSSARTDENGEFEIRHVGAGEYRVHAGEFSGMNFNPFAGNQEDDDSAIQVDGINDITGLQLTTDRPEETPEDDLPTVQLTGRVVDAAGNGIANASVSASPDTSSETTSAGHSGMKVEWSVAMGRRVSGGGSATTDDKGNFEMEARGEGPFNVSAHCDGFERGSVSAVMPGRKVVVTLAQLASVSGFVRTPDGPPTAGFKVRAQEVQEEGGSWAMMTTMFGGDGDWTDGNPDGSFFIDEVPIGQVEIHVKAAGYAAGESDAFAVDAGAQVEGISVTLTRGGTIVGQVSSIDTARLSGATVSLVQVDGDSAAAVMMARMMPSMFGGNSVTSDADGKFTIAHLAPGTYRLQVSHDDYAPSSSIDVDVRNDRDHKVPTVRLTHGATVEGLVREDNGDPKPGVMVQMLGSDAPMQMGSSDEEGRFTFKNVPEGEYTISISDMSGANGIPDTKNRQLLVKGAGTLPVEIVFGAGSKVHGKVTGLSDEGVHMVTLRLPGSPAPEDIDYTNPDAMLDSAKYTVAQVVVVGGEYTFNDVDPGTYILEIPVMPADPTDLDAYAKLDRTPLFREEITVVAKQDLQVDMDVR